MNFNNKLATAVSGAVLLMAGQIALADSTTDIVDALVAKGVLTEEEGKLISKGHTSKTSVTPVVKEKDGAFTLESANGRNSIQLTGRMHLDYRNAVYNGNWGSNEIGNYLSNSDRDTATMGDQFELRRARIGVKGKFAKDFNYEVVGNLPGTATIDVAYLNWAKYDAANLTIGKFKQPFGLEQLTSSNNIDFMERSYADQLSPAKKLGAMFSSNPRAGLNLAASVYAMHDSEQDMQSDKASFAARGTVNFAEVMGDKDSIMHVGLGFRDESYAVAPTITNNTSSSLSATSNLTRSTILGFRSGGRGLANAFRAQVAGGSLSAPSCATGNSVQGSGTVVSTTTCTGGYSYGDASGYTSNVKADAFALEGIFARGPFKIQGEFTKARYNGRSNANPSTDYVNSDVQAYYAEALWLVTGEKYSDAYKKGVFSSIKPKNDFDLDNGHWGAWELGVRYEGFDVKDGTVAGTNGSRIQGTVSPQGSGGNTCNTDGNTATTSSCSAGAKTYTAGIKWILNPNVRFMVNYVYTDFKNAFKPIDVAGTVGYVDQEELLMFRSQYNF